MAFSNWLWTSSSKNMLVKIVHPGGHVELYDRPVLAAEILLRNPRHCVAHPHVFQQPWAIVGPDTTLMPGQKFYIVPMSTIRKLQKHSLRYSPSLVHEIRSKRQSRHSDEGSQDDEGRVTTCWFFVSRKTGKKPNPQNCFARLFAVIIKIKSNGQETRSSSSNGSGERVGLTRKRRNKDVKNRKGGSPRRSFSSFDHWQPRLESINEECN